MTSRRLLALLLIYGSSTTAATLLSCAAGQRSLAVFTLVRGGPTEADYISFVNSRSCLNDAMPAGINYDDIAFYEGNVPLNVQRALSQQVYAAPLSTC
jgi:hypothetical protein